MEVTIVTDPTPKTAIRPIFCLLGSCKRMIIGIGSRMRRISLTMFATAVAMYKAGRLRQLPSLMLISQLMEIGVQAKMIMKNTMIVYTTINTIVAQMDHLNHF